MKIENKYINLYKEMHEDSRNYQGVSLDKEIPNIANLVLSTASTTVLDYGCGKGNQYKQSNSNILFHVKDENIFLYDPGFKEHDTLPDRTFDGVISTDVLEHIPEKVIPKTLNQIFERADKLSLIHI